MFSARGEEDIRIVHNDLTALNCMQLLTKLWEGLGIIKAKVGAECYGRVWFLTPHPCNHPFSDMAKQQIQLSYPNFFQIQNGLFLKTFLLSLISFPSVYPPFCLICYIKYRCRVNALYNMKLSNQLTITIFYPPPQKLLFGSSSQKLEISQIPIPSNGTLPHLPTLRNISWSGES